MTFYIKQTNQFIANGVDDKTLRQQLKEQGLDARRLSRFTQFALLGGMSLTPYIDEKTGVYLGSLFNSPSKFDKMFHQLYRHCIRRRCWECRIINRKKRVIPMRNIWDNDDHR